MVSGNVALSPGADVVFSPVDNELPLRWFRRLHLVPPGGLGSIRRAVFFAAVSWLPIAAWAALHDKLLDFDSAESLARHYGVQVRCLVAVPLFIIAESTLHAVATRIAANFVTSGTVAPARQPAFERTLRQVRRLRDSSLPWIFVLGAIIAWMAIDRPSAHDDALVWAEQADGALGFGGWWFAYVSRPIFIALLLGWLWRILLITYWFWRISRLDLSLVPSHPDRDGGIGFVEKLPGAYAPVTIAVSAVIASRWAHDITAHGATLQSFKLPLVLFAVVWTLFAFLPLLALMPPMLATRSRAVPAYAALVGSQGRLVHRRWILGEPVGEAPILDAPEIGPVADASVLYEAVKRMRVVPIGKAAVAEVLLPLALPMLVIAAMQVPLAELFGKLVKTLL